VLQRLPWALENTIEDPRGVAKGMLVACSFIPFLSDYLHHITSLVPASVKSIDYEYHLGATGWLRPTPETWAFVSSRYGLTELDLAHFLRLVLNAKLGTIVAWPLLAQLIERDE
jgi:hypothetical protein